MAMIAGFFMILSVIALGLWNYASTAANRTYDLLLEGSAIAILERISSGPEGISIDFPPSALEILGLADNDRVFYRIYHQKGDTLTGTPDLPAPPIEPSVTEAHYFDARYTGALVRFISYGKLVAGSNQARPIFVQIGQTRTARDQLKNDLFLKGMLVLIGLAVAGVAFARMSIHYALKPLSGVVRDIESREPSDLRSLETAPPREIAGLILAVNGFMRRLGASKDNAEGFIADVAHQIRTSLSALNGQLELASEEKEPAQNRQRLHKASVQARKTINLTNQLLAHAMVIHRADGQHNEMVDLEELIVSAIEEQVRMGLNPEVEFEFKRARTGSKISIQGDFVSLREAIRNLITNAAAHGGAAPRITISINQLSENMAGWIQLIVEDDGPGIPADQRAHVLERFATFGQSAGSGLGLSIVKSVAEAHKGSITLADSLDGGLRVELLLPLEAKI